MSEVKVSVIIPVYNVEKFLDECVKSVCNQVLKDIEVLLIDDGLIQTIGLSLIIYKCFMRMQ